MRRGPTIGIGIGIALVVITAVYAVSGIEPMDENSTVNTDQPPIQETPSGDSGEGQEFKVSIHDSINSADNP